MEVLLLGTGPAEGWPNPFCRCATCSLARASGEARALASALVDGTVLIDGGPDAPLAASRHGASLDGVRLLLVTHGHWDHFSPALLMPRHWAGVTTPLTIAGPAEVTAQYADWIAPGGQVSLVPVQAGDRLSVAGYDVRVLAAAHGDAMSGPGVLYDVTGPDGGTLFYATDTGLLPDPTLAATAGRRYDVVVLEETFGDHPAYADHLDLAGFAATVAALRRNGAVVGGTRVAPTHLGHTNPPPAELARRLALWGAELLPDGARIVTGAAPPSVAAAPRRVLILGGARSGKSVEAERQLAAHPAVTYVATSGGGDDPEWAARVAAHRERRPAHWRTVETTDVAELLRRSDSALLVDCFTTWLARVMDEAGCWSGSEVSGKALAHEVDELVAAWRATSAQVVAVVNEVGSGVVPATSSGRLFRDELGTLTTRLAAESDEVWHVIAGLPQRLR